MAKNRNTMAKRSRESEKRRKAQDKAERRKERKTRPAVPTPVVTLPPETDDAPLP
jgi:hypothetical protein